MFDFLLTHNYTENPTAFGTLITVMSSFFLASLVAMVYQWTTPSVQKSTNFLQSMVLISIVAAMVMQAIGDSLARGLGMLGALAIIRFRTKLDNPRNIAFMFAALANGIACGVYGFTIAFIGTISFCIAAVILKLSTLGTEEILTGSLKYQVGIKSPVKKEIESILKKHCKDYNLKSEKFININKTKTIKDSEGQVIDNVKREIATEYHYQLILKNHIQSQALAISLDDIKIISDIKLNFGDTNIRL